VSGKHYSRFDANKIETPNYHLQHQTVPFAASMFDAAQIFKLQPHPKVEGKLPILLRWRD